MKTIISALLTCICITTSTWAAPVNVVATLSTFGDLVKQIGGNHVKVYTIAPPNFNPHFIQPRPGDVLKVKKADLFVYSGLDLEVWSGPLLVAAANPKVRIGGDGHLKLSTGIPLLEVPRAGVSRSQGDIHAFGNPHFWVDPETGTPMAKTIAAKLSELDPGNAADYEANLTVFQDKLAAKIIAWKKELAPYAGSEFIGYHNEWPYLMQFISCKMTKFLEPKPGIPPGPKQLNALTQYAKSNPIVGIIHTSYFPVRPSKTLSKRTGLPVIMLAQNVGEQKQVKDYFALMDYNMAQLLSALKGK